MTETGIRAMFRPEHIFPNIQPSGTCCKDALHTISRLLAEICARDEKELYHGFLLREKMSGTAFGGGIAIPHARLPGDFPPVAIVVRLTHAIEWDAVDNVPVDTVIAFVTPEDVPDQYLEMLSAFARLLAHEEFCSGLKRISSRDLIHQYIIQALEPG